MKPLAEYFSPFVCHILSLTYKYSRNPHESTPCAPGERDQVFHTTEQNIFFWDVMGL